MDNAPPAPAPVPVSAKIKYMACGCMIPVLLLAAALVALSFAGPWLVDKAKEMLPEAMDKLQEAVGREMREKLEPTLRQIAEESSAGTAKGAPAPAAPEAEEAVEAVK